MNPLMLILLLPFSPIASPQPSGGIRDVDFRNLTYLLDGQQTTLRDGSAVVPDQADGIETRTVRLLEVAFGHLDSDFQEEAAVVLGYRGGGTGYFTRGYLYGLRNHRLVLLTTFKGGDRAVGGIDEVRIADGRLEVVRNHPEAACCPDYRIATWYRWNGRQLRVVRTERRGLRK